MAQFRIRAAMADGTKDDECIEAPDFVDLFVRLSKAMQEVQEAHGGVLERVRSFRIDEV